MVVLEKAERLEEAGAGLQLSPNASRVLIDLGLKDRLMRRVVTPEAISINSARAGGELLRLPLRGQSSAPYWVIHRADLQSVLADAVNDHPDIDLRLGCELEAFAAHARGLTIAHRSGTAHRQDMALALIGADGIWSTVRSQLFPEVRPQFSGLIAWRGTLEASQLPRYATEPRVQLWMGPNAHLVAYPISGGRQMNLVVVVPGLWNEPGWSTPGDTQELKRELASACWTRAARMLIGTVDHWRKWALFLLPKRCAWSDGGVALLGDAVHAMPPFAGQGAAMAIEDAAVLAKVLSERPIETTAEVGPVLKRYGLLRRSRARRMQRLALRQGRIYHLTGSMALARDLAIRATGPSRMLARQGWIYNWRV